MAAVKPRSSTLIASGSSLCQRAVISARRFFALASPGARKTAAKRFKRVESATALIWKLLLVAEKRFRRLDAPHLLKDVFEARKFEDGKPVSTQQRKNAA